MEQEPSSMTAILICAVVYTGIQSARLITQPNRSK
jgi:hypothetical protein